MVQQHALRLDREFATIVAGLGDMGVIPPGLPVGDVVGRRKRYDLRIQKLLSMTPSTADVVQRSHKIRSKDGTIIALEELRPKSAPTKASPAIYHVHGGGMILGSVASFAPGLVAKARSYGLPIFSIEYRLAPEHQHPVPVNDCYAGLEWLYANASELGVDCKRVMVFGESAGGGLAAGITLMARDKGLSPPVAYQMLTYPMLDDRNLEPQPSTEPYTKWRSDDNKTGWGALLGDAAGRDYEVDGHQYAAPARAQNLHGLPPTYIDVGGLDFFLKEDIEYAARLLDACVPVELHVYPGLPHDFESIGLGARIVQSALDNRLRVIEEFKL
jgi:acetyl esterase/lipase